MNHLYRLCLKSSSMHRVYLAESLPTIHVCILLRISTACANRTGLPMKETAACHCRTLLRHDIEPTCFDPKAKYGSADTDQPLMHRSPCVVCALGPLQGIESNYSALPLSHRDLPSRRTDERLRHEDTIPSRHPIIIIRCLWAIIST